MEENICKSYIYICVCVCVYIYIYKGSSISVISAKK